MTTHTTHPPLTQLLRARYGEAAPTLPPVASEAVLAQLLSHRSVRAFAPRALPEGTIETLVAAAQSAPSSSNLQTWSVVAVQDEGRKKRIAEYAGQQAHVAQAPLLLVWLADLARLQGLARDKALPLEGSHYLDSFLMAVIDAALAAQNALTAAESLGLGTVYLGAIRNRPEAVVTELELPPGVFALFGMSVGYPDEERPAAIKPRLPQSTVLSYERYAPPDQAGDVQRYDATMSAFYQAQGMQPNRWSDHSLARLKDASQLRGRHRLVEAIDGQRIGLK
jgi:nitroreductase